MHRYMYYIHSQPILVSLGTLVVVSHGRGRHLGCSKVFISLIVIALARQGRCQNSEIKKTSEQPIPKFTLAVLVGPSSPPDSPRHGSHVPHFLVVPLEDEGSRGLLVGEPVPEPTMLLQNYRL